MRHSRPSYQLTNHPVGSMAEIWAVSWPLMLTLCSGNIMMFADRLFVAHYSVQALNAMAVSGLACFSFLVFPFGIAQISEVFVGRFHGEESHEQVGKPTWQILWMILFAWPVMGLLSRFLSGLLFAPGSLEEEYFVRLLDFSPLFLSSVCLMGFFIGIGKTRVITYVTILGNLVNIILAPLLIFGAGTIPAMGITGAAIATGIAQGAQVVALLVIYLRKTYREKFQTHRYQFEPALSKEILKVAVPSSIGRFVEVVAILLFFRLLAYAGGDALTASTMVQSFYLLSIFCVDGMAKGVTSVVSNLVGAKEYSLIPKAIRAGLKVHTAVAIVVGLICLLCCESIYTNILHEGEVSLMQSAQFSSSLKIALGWMCLFMLLDGYSWIMSGHLMALGDTKYIMYVTSCTHWLTYVVPLYILLQFTNVGAGTAWAMLALDGLVMFLLFWLRSQRQSKIFV